MISPRCLARAALPRSRVALRGAPASPLAPASYVAASACRWQQRLRPGLRTSSVLRALAGHAEAADRAASGMRPETEELVARLHSNSSKAVVYATGGAVQATSWMLCVPGASNTVLECAVPYARDSLVDILGAVSSAATPNGHRSIARSSAPSLSAPPPCASPATPPWGRCGLGGT